MMTASANESSNGKFFYGWWIVAVSIVCLALMWTLPVTCFSLFLKPISASMGFERSSIALCASIVALSSMFMSPFVGRWMEQKSVKLVLGLSITGVAAGFVGYSLATSLPMFYLSALLIGISLNGSSIMAFNIIIKNWFIEKQGLAMSIALAGTGLGGMIMSPIINSMILTHGWRFAYQALAVLILVLVLPLALIFIKKKPQDMGLMPYGYGHTPKKGSSAAIDLNLTLAQVKQYPMFWIFMLGIASIGFAGGAVLLQAPAYISDQLSPTKAAAAVSAYLGIAIAGKIILGAVFDAKGSKAGIMLSCITLALSIVTLFYIKQETFYFAFILLHGFGTCTGTVTPPVLTSRIFGAKNYGPIYGMTNLFLQAGMAIGSPVIAYVFDKTGSYFISWQLCLAVSLIALFSLLYSVNAGRKLLETRKEA